MNEEPDSSASPSSPDMELARDQGSPHSEADSEKIWWLPTFGFFAFLNIQFCLFGGMGMGLGDPATARHLRSGLYIHDTGVIPHADWLTYYQPPLPWIDFEWAFESLLITVYNWGGGPLLTTMLYGLYGLCVLTIHRTVLKAGFSLPVTTFVTGMVGLCLLMHFNVRPPMITYLFLATVVEVWRLRPKAPELKDWIILPIMFCFWTGLHGGWIAGFLFMGLTLAGRFLDLIFHGQAFSSTRFWSWVGLFFACLAGTLLNPWGWDMHIHLVVMTVAFKSFALWDEYHVPNFAGPSLAAWIILIYLAITLGTRLLKKAPVWSFETGLPLLILTYFAFKAQRHAMLLAIVAAVPLGCDLEFILREYLLKGWTGLTEWLNDFQERQRSATGDAWMCLVSWVVIAGLYLHSDRVKDYKDVGNERVTVGAVDFIKAHMDHFKRPLTTTGNGGPLVWLLRPNFKSSFDDRGDMFGDDYVFDMIHLELVGSDWRKVLDRGHFDSAIIESNLALAHILDREPGWRLVYPSQAVILKQEGTDNPFIPKPSPTPTPTPAPTAKPGPAPDDESQYIFFYDPPGSKGS